MTKQVAAYFNLEPLNKLAPGGFLVSDFIVFVVLVTVLVLVSIGLYKQDQNPIKQECEDAAAIEAGQTFSQFFNWKNWMYAGIGLLILWLICYLINRFHKAPTTYQPPSPSASAYQQPAYQRSANEEFADLSTLSSLSTLSRQLGDVTELNSIGDVLRM